MKNVKENQAYKCIIKKFDEFQQDVTIACGNVKVDYEYAIDEVFFNNGDTDLDIDEVKAEMSRYYDVDVCNFFLTGCETTYICVVYV